MKCLNIIIGTCALSTVNAAKLSFSLENNSFLFFLITYGLLYDPVNKVKNT